MCSPSSNHRTKTQDQRDDGDLPDGVARAVIDDRVPGFAGLFVLCSDLKALLLLPIGLLGIKLAYSASGTRTS